MKISKSGTDWTPLELSKYSDSKVFHLLDCAVRFGSNNDKDKEIKMWKAFHDLEKHISNLENKLSLSSKG